MNLLCSRHWLWCLLVGFLIQTLPSLAQGRRAPLADAPLAKEIHGQDALQTLGLRLRDIAEFHRLPEAELRQRLERDRSLWVDRRGRLFYVCDFGLPPKLEGPVGESTNSPPLNPLYSLALTFKLHSRPGASRIIYLDFDGHDASATVWAAGTGNAPIARPFDLDGNPLAFSTTERTRIQYIWARVAEDYLQYDLDVTTEDPGAAALKNTGTGRYGVRVVVGGDSTDWYGSGAGGVAYLNSFEEAEDLPCWVFPKSLSDSEKSIAEACSHEAGHTLGLHHDGLTTGVEYYAGQGNWAPIMGVGYDRPIVQWSKGEYNLANNLEDDLTRMLSFGAIAVADDHGDTIATATPLTGVRPFTWGVISRRTDLDFFSFQAGAGRTTITVSPASRGPNLRLQLALYDRNGSLVTSSNVADNGTSGVLPVTLSVILPTGNYFLSVDGIGSGNPLTDGYSDYASLGQYTVSMVLPGDGTWATTGGDSLSFTNPANWSAGTIPLGASATARFVNDITGDQFITLDMPITLGSLWLGDANSSHAFALQSSGPGTLRFAATNGSASITKASGLADSIAVPIQLDCNLAVTNTTAVDLVLAGPLAGPFTLTTAGSGRLLLAGTNNASGGLVVAEGSMALGSAASVAAVSAITVQSGAIFDVSAQPGGWPLASAQLLAGDGVVTGAVLTATNSRIAPGALTAPGTLTFAGQLTLNAGTTLEFQLGAVTNAGAGSNDLIAVAGDLVVNGPVTVTFDFAGALPETNSAYTLLTYGGALVGGATNFVAATGGTRFACAFDDSVPGEIRVLVSGAPAALIWQGGASGNLWDVGSTTNWLDGGVPTTFQQGDAVLFDSAGASVPAIDLSGALAPASVIVSNTAAYTFSGSGRLSGLVSLTKQGGGSLTLSTSNDFSGATLVQDGTVVIGNAAALGRTNVGTTVSGTGQLDLNGFALGYERLTLSGSGPAGDGAVINTGSAQTNALRLVTLSGDTTLGGSARWDLRGVPAANITASLTGNGFSVTKTGPNEIWLANFSSTFLGNITVNQGTLGFEGTNLMANSTGLLTVNAGATVAFLNTFDSDFSKVLALNSCTVQSDSGHNTLLGGGPISGIVTADVGEAATLDLRGGFSGGGGFNKTGAGILRLAGASSFTGGVTINAGLVVAGHNAALGGTAGATTVAAGGGLDLAAYNLGAEPIFAAGSGINGRGAILNSLLTSQINALRFVTLTDDTTFGGNGRWDIRANPTGSLLGAFNLTKVGKNEVWLVNLDATQLKTILISEGTLGFQGTTTMGDAGGSLTITSGGTLGFSSAGTNVLTKMLSMNSGRLSCISGSNALSGSLSLTGSNQIDVVSAATLLLGGTGSGSGYFAKTSAGSLILAGDSFFNGTSRVSGGTLQIGNGGASGSFAGALSNNASVVFDRTSDITHAAAIGGVGTLTKQNINTLTLAGANTYSGTLTVSAGILRVGNASALGSSVAGTTVASGATLDINGFNLGAEVITASGPGVGGAGAVINKGAAQNNALQFLVLGGDTTLGGSARWDLRGVGGVGELNCGSQPFALTKVGSNTVALSSVTVDPALGNVWIQQGVLALELATTGLGNPAASATVSGGAALQLYSLNNALNKVIILGDGGKLSHSGPVLGGNDTIVSGPILLSPGNAYVENASALYALQLDNTVGGAGHFNKTGAGLVRANAALNHTGETIVQAGTLKLGPTAALTLTPAISVAAGASLDVSLLGGAWTLGAGQTLAGDGTVVGNVIANGTVSPGASMGRLAISGSATLAGNTVMDVARFGATLTNDVLSVVGTLACGGTVTVMQTGDALAQNDSFRLFSADAFAGSFAGFSLPALTPGLTWSVSSLNSNGWLRVVSNTPPVMAAVDLNGSGLVVSGSGGAPGALYVVLAATNVALPLPEWSAVATNLFDGDGSFSFTNTVAPLSEQLFFRLRVP